MRQEHSIFVSYRKEDGSLLANAMYYLLHGRGQTFYQSDRFASLMLTVHIDIGIPGAVDWMDHIATRLREAGSLIVVCSPGAATEKDLRPDWLYEELNWWANNKNDQPPILIALEEHGHQHVPAIILETWPNLQVVKIESEQILSADWNHPSRRLELFMQALFQGIRVNNSQSIPNYISLDSDCLPNVASWEKDRFHRYVRVNENYANAAGYDSPHAMVGKTDEQMPWRKLAGHFQQGDDLLMSGKMPKRCNSQETEIMVDRVASILVNESVILDSTGRAVGVRGSFIDISGSPMEGRKPQTALIKEQYDLGPEFDNQHFNLAEVYVFQSLLWCKHEQQIAAEMGIDISEAKYLVNVVRIKLGCEKVSDILTVVARSGLPLYLFGIDECIHYRDISTHYGK